MKYLVHLLLLIFFSTQSVFSYFNERHYVGKNQNWKNADLNLRMQIVGSFLPKNPVVFEAGAKMEMIA